jgi:hypothetical protein
VASGIHGHRSAAETETLKIRLRDAQQRLAFVRHYLKELQDQALHDPEHEAALQLTLAAETRAVEECQRLSAALESPGEPR